MIQRFFLAIFRKLFDHLPEPTNRCSSKMKKAFLTSTYFSMLFQLSTCQCAVQRRVALFADPELERLVLPVA
jgi:hypothetical protein